MSLAYDFHIHSCLSPCGDADMTPANIVGMAQIAGLNAIALTDHNTCGNVRPFFYHAEQAGIIALGGMELTTMEEVHVVCLFAEIDLCERFSDEIYKRLPNIKNRSDVFGEQVYMNEKDEPVGVEEKLLINATDIGVYDIAALVKSFGGIAFPAHINRSSFSLMSNLGMWDDLMGFKFAERTHDSDLSSLPDVPYLINSDSHYLETLGQTENTLQIDAKTAAALIDYMYKLC